MVSGALLLLAAGGLFYRNIQEEQMAEVYSAQTLSEIRLVIPTLDEKSEAIVAAANDPNETALIAAQTQEALRVCFQKDI